MSFEFPDVTQLPGFSYPERAFSRQSDDSTPQATPRATPRPSLRDSIRAASRHSLVKLSTPGLSKFDKNTSIRSLRGSKYERNERVGRKKENSESSKDASTDDNLDAYNDQAVVEIHSHYHKSVTEIPVIIESPRDTGCGTEKLTSLHDRNGIKVKSPRDTGIGTEQLTSLHDRNGIKVEAAGNITKNDNSEEVNQGNSDRSFQRRDSDKVVREVDDISHNSSQWTKSKSDDIKHGHCSVLAQDYSDVDKPILNSSGISDSSNNGNSAINNIPFQFENLESKSSSTDSISPAINPSTVFTNEHPNETSTSNPDFDPYLPHGTPVSFSSGVSCSSHSILFMGTSEHFYYVCPQVGNELETTLKNYEQFQLVEECYQRKILPEYILRIINSRRVNDVNARNFVRNLPYDLIQKMNADDSTAGMCVSS